jgi:hypothetical protein
MTDRQPHWHPDQAAYWQQAEQLLEQRTQRKWDSFSWITGRALLSASNDRLSRLAPGLVTELRAQWMAQVELTGGALPANLVIDRSDCSRFIIVGDPGEQDASQFVVVPALLAARAEDPDIGLMLVCSDVIYPSGDVNDYVDGSYVPYAGLADLPTYALPGNHDWYDGLAGFMWHWCGQDRLPSSVYGPTGPGLVDRVTRLFWRRPSTPATSQHLVSRRQQRWAAQQSSLVRTSVPRGTGAPLQRTPYFAIRTKHLLLVCIDTGIDGTIDPDQGEWLLSVSREPGPKVLLTGKPLLVNQTWHACAIRPPLAADGSWFRSVGEIVEHPEHRYLASIGGDIHNFQHYVRQGRPHLVSGGGGAFMSATHPIAEAALALPEPERQDPPLALSPGAAQSLSHYADLELPRLWRIQRATLLLLAGVLAAASVSWSGAMQQGLAWSAAVLAALVVLRLVFLPEAMHRRRAYRGALCVVSAGAGWVLGLAVRWLAPGHARDLVWTGLATVVGLGLTGQVLRWTGWWRPSPTDVQVRDQRQRASAGPAPAASGERVKASVRDAVAPARPSIGVDPRGRVWVVAGVLGAGLVALWAGPRDGWVVAAAVVTLAVWVLGATLGRRPVTASDGTQSVRASWRTTGVLLAYLTLAFDTAVVLARTTGADAAVAVVAADVVLGVLALLVGVAVVLTVVLECAVLAPISAPLTPVELLRGGRPRPETERSHPAPPVPASTRARRFGRLGLVAPWALLVASAGSVVALDLVDWPPWLRDRAGPVHLLPQVILTGLVVTVVSPVVIDTARRHVGRRYRLWLGLVAALVTGVVVLTAHPGVDWLTSDVGHDVVAVLVVATLGLVAVVVTHLVLVGTPSLIVDLDAHRVVGPGEAGRLVPVGDAQLLLDERAGGGTAPVSSPVRRRADIVAPGSDQPQGPLQKAVAEIFDSDRPPFFKNFLVCESEPDELTVRVVIVTGEDDAPAPVVISIPVR